MNKSTREAQIYRNMQTLKDKKDVDYSWNKLSPRESNWSRTLAIFFERKN